MSLQMSLKFKFLLSVGGIVAISIAGLFYQMDRQAESAIMEQVDSQSRVLLQQMIVARSWVADHGGVFVRQSAGIDSNPYLANRDIVDQQGRKYVMRNPALTTRELSEYTSRAGLYSFRLSSLTPLNPANKPSPFEEQSLRQFASAGFEESRDGTATIELDAGKRVYRRIIPLRVEQACLACHAHQGYKIGDIRGGISVKFPLGEADKLITQNRLSFIFTGFGILFLVLISIYMLMQRIILSPIDHLHRVADDLTSGRYTTRATLHTGDELESLAHALNSMTDEIIGSYESAVKSLAAAVEARDPYTRGHIDRVAKYAVAIAGELGLEAERLPEVKLGAVLHDIGKIGISDSILCKPGVLATAEFAEMQAHPRMGVDIIADSKFLAPLATAILHHHERFDGSGYPEGLQGEHIPIIARILTVADTFDAMTSDRPYRSGLSREVAVTEIRQGAGGQFDPRIVEAFMTAYEKGLLK
jgi:HAMP domain-containing protein